MPGRGGAGESPAPAPLPDGGALLWRQVHFVAGLDAKGIVEGLLVHHHAVDARLGGRVGVCLEPYDQEILTVQLAIGVSLPDKEALIAS